MRKCLPTLRAWSRVRALVLLAAAAVLAGCATPGGPGTDTPTTATPGPTGGTPPTSSTPEIPEGEPWTQVRGGWTLQVEPGTIQGYPGDALDVAAQLTGPRGANGQLTVASAWADPSRGNVPVVDGRATFEARAYPGAADAFPFYLSQPNEPVVSFDGPQVRAQGVEREVGFALHTGVNDLAPGLTVEVVNVSSVRVTFNARENATTTADETVGAVSELMLVRTGTETRLVAFVMRSASDAVAVLPQEQRTRLVAEMEDVPMGDVRVMVYTVLSCFCIEFEPPQLHETTVFVDAPGV